MSQEKQRRGKRLGVKISEEVQRGVYTNQMLVAHTRNEFVLDFLVTFPPEPAVVSRVVTSPGHLKRIIQALQDNLRRYEESFGPVEPSPPAEPHGGAVN